VGYRRGWHGSNEVLIGFGHGLPARDVNFDALLEGDAEVLAPRTKGGVRDAKLMLLAETLV